MSEVCSAQTLMWTLRWDALHLCVCWKVWMLQRDELTEFTSEKTFMDLHPALPCLWNSENKDKQRKTHL